MTETGPLIFIATLILLIHLLAVGRRSSFVTVDGIFVYSTWTMVAGSLALLNFANPTEARYGLVVLLPFAAYVAASILLFEAHQGPWKALSYDFKRVATYQPTAVFWALFALSVVVTLAYYASVGYNLFFSSLTGSRFGTAEFSALRLDSYAGSKYLFPGYVNQFKNVLLPSLSVVASVYLLRQRVRGAGFAVLGMAALSCYGLLGTGQRGAFVLFTLTLAAFLFMLGSEGRGRRFLILFLAAAPVFAAATLFQQRNAALDYESAGLASRFSAILSEIAKRFLVDNQEAGRIAFEYIRTRPTSWGWEWGQQILGVLPGNTGSTLSTEVATYLWGSDRGTVPLTLWGSTFHNWGWVGLVLMAVLLAALYRRMTEVAFSRPFPNTLELIGISGTFVSFGMWLAGGPESILNDGAVVYLALWWFGRRTSRPQTPSFGHDFSGHFRVQVAGRREVGASHRAMWPPEAPPWARESQARSTGPFDSLDLPQRWNHASGEWSRSTTAQKPTSTHPIWPSTHPRWPPRTRH